MADEKTYKVKEVALVTGVSVRTLHYYDEIGLLTPRDRTSAGYRLYVEDDLLRLQQILIARSIGLSLEEIRRSLDDPNFDYAHSLRQQRALLADRLTETHKMIAAIDTTLADLGNSKREINFEAIFDGFDPQVYEDEVQEQWGDTNQYAQSAARTRNYTDADWRAIKMELDQIWTDAADAMNAGKVSDSAVVLAIVESHRRYICRWFYELSPVMHVQLADMWNSDERFREGIDKHGAGLTVWLAQAVRAAAELA